MAISWLFLIITGPAYRLHRVQLLGPIALRPGPQGIPRVAVGTCSSGCRKLPMRQRAGLSPCRHFYLEGATITDPGVVTTAGAGVTMAGTVATVGAGSTATVRL